MAQNSGVDKNQQSTGSYDYVDVMEQLDKQSSKKEITVQIGDYNYTLFLQ